MFAASFGIKENPFKITPNLRFVYLGENFRTVRAEAARRMAGENGAVLLMARAGVGKSILLRLLANDLEGTGAGGRVLSLSGSPGATVDHLVRQALDGFAAESGEEPGQGGVRDPATPIVEDHLERFVGDCIAADRPCMILIDEAQNLSDHELGRLFLLIDRVDHQGGRLRIALAGPPELEDRLGRALPRDFQRRIVLRRRLEPLPEREVASFIAERLAAAGCRREDLFAADAVAAIARYSEGVPRLVNTLCATALFLAEYESRDEITADLVDEAARHVERAAPVQGTAVIPMPPRPAPAAGSSTAGAPVARLVARPPVISRPVIDIPDQSPDRTAANLPARTSTKRPAEAERLPLAARLDQPDRARFGRDAEHIAMAADLAPPPHSSAARSRAWPGLAFAASATVAVLATLFILLQESDHQDKPEVERPAVAADTVKPVTPPEADGRPGVTTPGITTPSVTTPGVTTIEPEAGGPPTGGAAAPATAPSMTEPKPRETLPPPAPPVDPAALAELQVPPDGAGPATSEAPAVDLPPLPPMKPERPGGLAASQPSSPRAAPAPKAASPVASGAAVALAEPAPARRTADSGGGSGGAPPSEGARSGATAAPARQAEPAPAPEVAAGRSEAAGPASPASEKDETAPASAAARPIDESATSESADETAPGPARAKAPETEPPAPSAAPAEHDPATVAEREAAPPRSTEEEGAEGAAAGPSEGTAAATGAEPSEAAPAAEAQVAALPPTDEAQGEATPEAAPEPAGPKAGKAPNPSGAAAAPPEPAAPTVDELLSRARRQVAALALTTPKGDNAFETYQQVLVLAPGQPQALQGFQDIADKYVALAHSAERKGEPDRAKRYYAKAAAVVAGRPSETGRADRRAAASAPEPVAAAPDVAQDAAPQELPAIAAIPIERAPEPAPPETATTATAEPPRPATPAAPPQGATAKEQLNHLLSQVFSGDSTPPAQTAPAIETAATVAQRTVGQPTEPEPAQATFPMPLGVLASPVRLEAALAVGADVNTRFADGRTPLIVAAGQRRSDMVKLLLAHGAEPDAATKALATPLMYAVWNGDLASMEALLQAGADVNLKNIDGKTALMAAAANGHAAAVDLLLRHGAQVNARTLTGWTALMYAAWGRHIEVVEQILEHGADIALVNDDGDSAASIAADRGHFEIANLLRSQQARSE